MKYTDNYGLKKPDLNDYIEIDDLNENADIIDEKLKEHEDELDSKETPAGAQAKADQAEQNAKAHADQVAQTAESNAKQYTDEQVGNVEVPGGIIVMWSGTHTDIPSGWLLCDGTNGTPDLRDRFILGATSESDIGDTGG